MTLFYVIIACISEMKKIQSSANQHFQSVLNGHERLKLQLESQKRELELRRIELEKREARNESERKKLDEEINKVRCFSNFVSSFLSFCDSHSCEMKIKVKILFKGDELR